MATKFRKHNNARICKHLIIRKKVSGTEKKPRLNVFRSAKHIYAQLIDDIKGVTLASASTIEKGFGCYGGNKEAAHKIGLLIAERAQKLNIKAVVFDRGGYLYHGRVKKLADAAREGGLNF